MKQVKFELLGKEYVVNPTFRKIAAIEEELKRGIFEVYNDMAEGHIKISDLACILYHAAGDFRSASLDKIGEAVLKDPATYITVVGTFLSACMSGSEELATDGNDGSKEKND